MRRAGLLGLIALGCATDEVLLPEVEPALDPTASAGVWPPLAPEHGTQLHIVGEPLQPGEETEMCHYINLGNDAELSVNEITLDAAPGLHHSIISRIPTEREDSAQRCFGFPGDLQGDLPLPLFATSTQVDSEAVDLPDGVAMVLRERQQLIVNYHYVNTTREPIVPEVYLGFHELQGELESRSGFYSFTNVGDINIPPGGTQSITMTCPFPDPALLLSVTPHMHRLGRRFEVRRHDGEQPAEVLASYEGWFDPETTLFDPGVVLGEGDGLTITCEWESDVDTYTRFGESSEHEMCFVFGYFYPAQLDVIGLDGFGCTVDDVVTTPAGG